MKGFVEKGSEWKKNNVYYIPNGIEETEITNDEWQGPFNEHLSKDILRERVGIDLLATIPAVSDMNATAIWDCVKVIQSKRGRGLLKPPFMTMIERILPNEIVKEFGAGKSNWFE